MKIIAIICEYNPFHNGHKYQLDELRRRFGADSSIIAIMSGSFVQRGDAALLDKYARAEMAVRCGCDLVLELPAPWSMSSAEFFARGGVEIAAALGIVDVLAFGSENGDLTALCEVAARLDSDEFAVAFEKAKRRSPDRQVGVLRGEVCRTLFGDENIASDVFGGSNDLLAIEYIRAIKRVNSRVSVHNDELPLKQVEPYAIKRIGNTYNSDKLSIGNNSDNPQYASATAIRRLIFSENTDNVINSISAHIPAPAVDIMKRELEAGRLHRLANLDIVVTAFLRLDWRRMSGKMEVSGGIENRLHSAALRECTVNGIVEAACERRYSRSRLRRALIGSMLGFTMRECEEIPRFASLLAANARGRELLAALRKTASIAILSKPSDGNKLLCKNEYFSNIPDGEKSQYSLTAYEQFERAMIAEQLHELCTNKPDARVENLYSRRAIMI
ncbi:MAG: nucleotidyltransferase family protein [Clostridiales bacterium]|nr:nucleotidyltransferase family protein [Clostridiales bacterium]